MVWVFGCKGPSGFSARSTAEEVTEGVDGKGLVAIVTGAGSGFGAETTRVLALRGVRVVMAVRSSDLYAATCVKEGILSENPTAQLDIMELDLASMASVRKFASEFIASKLPLNILINNAGIMATPFLLSQDGIELQFATNYLGHFLLTHLLLETMKSTAQKNGIEGRIVNLSSIAHKLTYKEGIRFDKINNKYTSDASSTRAYGQSKLANLLHANELSRRLMEEGVRITANSLHPGVSSTKLWRYHPTFGKIVDAVSKFTMKSVPQGAATTCYVALNPQVRGVSGRYFCDSNEANPSKLGRDAVLAKKLWDFSMDFIK